MNAGYGYAVFQNAIDPSCESLKKTTQRDTVEKLHREMKGETQTEIKRGGLEEGEKKRARERF